MRRVISAVVLALFAVCPVCLAQAERITDFTSRITVEADGWLAVTETITADARGVDVKHGIYRDFPTHLQGPVSHHPPRPLRDYRGPLRRPPLTVPHRPPEQRPAPLHRQRDSAHPARPSHLPDILPHKQADRLFRRPRRTLLECHRQRLDLSHRESRRLRNAPSRRHERRHETKGFHRPQRFKR